jgi:putative nucleotidyltransferase-like protein
MIHWASRLQVDAKGAVVRAEFETAGIEHIVIKGAGFAQLLYDPGELRTYGDTDLLISESDRPRAEALLRDLGFVDRTVIHAEPRPPHATTWQHEAEGATIDLHWRLPGTRAPASEAWVQLRRHTVQTTIAGLPAAVLDEPASAMLCALHVSLHGLKQQKPLEDLSRAVARLPLSTWRTASALADSFDASDEFTDGLRLSPEGDQIADALQLQAHASVAARLHNSNAARGAMSIQLVRDHPRVRDRARFVFLVVFPAPATLRTRFVFARRGAPGLATAYVVNPFWVVRRAPAAIRHWRTEARRYG